MKSAIAAMLLFLGIVEFYWPGSNGFYFAPSDVSAGEGRIIWAILTVGAAIVWCLPPAQKP